MSEQRLIDANELRGIESLLNTDIIRGSKEASWLMSQVLHDIDAMPTIDPETMPIVRELREKMERTEQELRNVKYCYDIAKNGERQLRRQVNEVTAEWAECAKKLKRATAERDAAVSDMKNFSVDWWEDDNGFPCKYCKHQLADGRCKWKMSHKESDGCFAYEFEWRGPDGDRP